MMIRVSLPLHSKLDGEGNAAQAVLWNLFCAMRLEKSCYASGKEFVLCYASGKESRGEWLWWPAILKWLWWPTILKDSGFGVRGLGFGVRGSELKTWGLGLEFKV